MIEKVGLEPEYLKRYPSQLSGGQRQRIAIAVALIGGSDFIVADEPVSALDMTIQKQVLELLLKLQKEFGLSILFISHDLNVIAQICDCALVLYQGKVVEEGTICDIFDEPKHEYTKCLLGNKL